MVIGLGEIAGGIFILTVIFACLLLGYMRGWEAGFKAGRGK